MFGSGLRRGFTGALHTRLTRMRWKILVAISLLQFTLVLPSPGQTSLHHLSGITAMPDRTVSLELAGNLPVSFGSYFDLYVLDASSNAVDWIPLTTLLRTNSSTARLFHAPPAVV